MIEGIVDRIFEATLAISAAKCPIMTSPSLEEATSSRHEGLALSGYDDKAMSMMWSWVGRPGLAWSAKYPATWL